MSEDEADFTTLTTRVLKFALNEIQETGKFSLVGAIVAPSGADALEIMSTEDDETVPPSVINGLLKDLKAEADDGAIRCAAIAYTATDVGQSDVISIRLEHRSGRSIRHDYRYQSSGNDVTFGEPIVTSLPAKIFTK